MSNESAPTDDETLSQSEQDELIQELERKRTLTGTVAIAASVVAITFSLFQVWLAAHGFEFNFSLPVLGEVALGSLQQLQLNAVHVGFALVLAFLLYPPSTGDGFLSRRLGLVVPAARDRFGESSPVTRALAGVAGVVRWLFADSDARRVTPFDWLLILLTLATVHYYLTNFSELLNTVSVLGLTSAQTLPELYPVLSPISAVPILGTMPWAYFLGVAAVLLVLEATRRALSFYLMCIVGSFAVYARFAHLIPLDAPIIGTLSTPQSSWAIIIRNFWYTDQGILGVPVMVSVQYIFIFILFGAFLEASGAGQWLIDLAYSATGKRKGGPAKASILGSGFMGMISGSSIANTVTTGAFTIPLMKQSGYRSEFAGGVEASASSGGQILPPVMGAAAFLIVEFTASLGTTYADVIAIGVIPAVVFFFGVWVMVHLEASREDIGGVETADLVNIGKHLTRGWFYLVPIALLLFYIVVERLTVSRSAWFTILAILSLISVVAAYGPRTRNTLAVSLVGLLGGRGVLAVVAGSDPIGAIVGSLGWLLIGAGVVTMLVHPRESTPLLSYNDTVPDAAERTADAFGRPSLASNSVYKYGTFVVKALDEGARTATMVVIAVAAAGIIPGVVATTGLGPNLVSLITNVAGGSLVLLLLITAVGSIILGMGMPTTVTYIILVSLLAPAVTAVSDVPVLAVHLFVLYFGVIADITPPVAVAAYAASGVAKSDPFQTGIEAFSLSLNKVIVPFAFVLSPGIILLRGRGGDARVLTLADVTELGYFVPEVLIPIIGTFLGVVALAGTVIGYLYTELSQATRIGFAVSSVFLMAPGLFLLPLGIESVPIDVAARAVGGVIFVALVLLNRRKQGEETTPEPAGDPTPN